MNSPTESGIYSSATHKERISFIKQMLAELSQIARAEQADLLVYLLEMAYTEASEILAGRPELESQRVKRNKTGRMSM